MPLSSAPNHPIGRLRDHRLLRSDAFINGAWITGAARFAVHDPATGEEIARVADLDVPQAQAAIAAAHTAWASWRSLGPKQRSRILRRWFDLLLGHQNDLACILTAENGKPLQEAASEVAYAANFVEWYAEEAKRIQGEVIASFDPNRRTVVLRQPIGVCAAITPWNFPLAMVTRKVAPALAAGCTVVLKPAEQTPLSALAAAELAQRAGLPPGVLNVITASDAPAMGRALCESPAVRHLSFTGSTDVGRLLMAQCAPTIKKLALELGGNAPFIVFDDADIDSAVSGAMSSKFRNAGQTCVCANRFYVQDAVYDRFVEKLAEKMQSLHVGSGFDPGVTQGPLIDRAAMEKVRLHVEDALAHGARLLAGGQALRERFFAPTLVADATEAMRCAREETFGPLAPVFRFHTEEEAIAAANATEYGLACYFYSRDMGRITRVSEALEYGMVGVNTGMLGSEQVPFGGIKQSGLGREGSRHGMEEYLEMKLVVTGDVLA